MVFQQFFSTLPSYDVLGQQRGFDEPCKQVAGTAWKEEGLRRALGIDGRDNFSQQLSITFERVIVLYVLILTVTDGTKYVTNRGKDISKRVYILILEVVTNPAAS